MANSSTDDKKRSLIQKKYILFAVVITLVVLPFSVTKYEGRVLRGELSKIQSMSLFSNWEGDFNPPPQGNLVCLETCINAHATFYALPSASSDELVVSLKTYLQKNGYALVSEPVVDENIGYPQNTSVRITGKKGKVTIELSMPVGGGYSNASASY